MKIKRVIRFQEEVLKEEIKQENPKKPKKDVSSNNDILIDKALQQNCEDLGFEEDDQEIQEEDSTNNASYELRKLVERVAAGRSFDNMIGVFGINSDVVINNMCSNLSEMTNDITFVGQVEYSTSLSDVYNSIAAIFLNYINTHYVREDMRYYLKEVMLTLEKVYDNHQNHDEDISSLSSLSNINRRYERDKNLLSAINRIKQLTNSLSHSRNREPKFLVAVEMERLDYKTLNMLAKLKSSDLIIIVFSILDFNLARISLSNSVGSLDCMDKFFYTGNCIIAKANAI